MPSMAHVAESNRTKPDGIFFELDQFELAGEDRLELRGRWFGVRGRRFVRPTLMLNAAGERRRALADLEHKPWSAEDGELWEAAFPCGVDGKEVAEVELAVAPDIAIPLPAPSESQGAPRRIPAQEGVALPVSPAQVRRPDGGGSGPSQDLPRARREIELLRTELQSAAATKMEAQAELTHTADGRDQAMAERNQAVAERDDARSRAAAAEAERDDAFKARAESELARDHALQERDHALQKRDQALAEHAAMGRAHAELIAQRDDALRSRDGAVQMREEALDTRDRALAELGEHRRASGRIQAQRDEELALRGAAMVMRGATRAESLKTSWAPRAVAIACLIAALIAVAIVLHIL